MTRCPLCKSSSTSFLFTSYNRHGRHDIDKKDTFKMIRCTNCDVIFLEGITINNKYYQKYYDTGYYDGELASRGSVLDKAVSILETYSLKQKEKIILSHAPKRKHKLSILDVGCGSGKFLASLQQKKFDKYGIEINKEGIELSKKNGIKVYERDITKIDFGKKKFDIITLWHVLEHLTDPVSVFKKIYSILADDGIVLSASPNTSSIGAKIGKEKWFHLDSPRHLILFNMKSTEYLAAKTGFKINASINEYYDYPLDIFWSVKGSKLKYFLYPLYPIVKILDNEALTLILKKSNK